MRPHVYDPPNSEISEQILKRFPSSTCVISDFEKALQRNGRGFTPIRYHELTHSFKLADLDVCPILSYSRNEDKNYCLYTAEAKNREKPSGLEIVNDILRWSYVPPEKSSPAPYGMRCRCTARISSTGELRL